MTDRERLIDLMIEAKRTEPETGSFAEHLADYLLEHGVIVTPCIAMVEQFIKDGRFDRKHTAHNGRIAVVYVDKSKYSLPLIDITEQFYNIDKAIERVEALKEREVNENL